MENEKLYSVSCYTDEQVNKEAYENLMSLEFQNATLNGEATHYNRMLDICGARLLNGFKNEYEDNEETLTITHIYQSILTEDNKALTMLFEVAQAPRWNFVVKWDKVVMSDVQEKCYAEGTFSAKFSLLQGFTNEKNYQVSIKVYPFVSDPDETEYCSYPALKILQFVINEPALAFCHSYYGWDYNTFYHTRNEVQKFYNKFLRDEKKAERVLAKNEAAVYNWVVNNILPFYEDAFVFSTDVEDDKSQIMVPLEKNSDTFNTVGTYSWFVNEDGKKTKEEKQYDRLVSRCRARAALWDVSWEPSFDKFLYVYSAISHIDSSDEKIDSLN